MKERPKVKVHLKDAAPFKIDGVYCRLIALTQGQYAIVGATDYERLNAKNWHVKRCPDGRYYAVRMARSNGADKLRKSYMHREILGLSFRDAMEGDHIDSASTLDNRRKNLRLATDQQQQYNKRVYQNSKSGLKGVWLHRQTGKWRSAITVKKTVICLGLHDSPELAHDAYRLAAIKHHGEFARFA